MSSTEPADFLRERNKDLLKRLKQQREKLERVSGCSRKRDREDEAEERRQPGETVPGTEGGRGPARAGLTRPAVRFAESPSDTCERQAGIKHTLVTPPSQTAQCADSSDLLDDGERHLQIQDRLQDTSHMTKSCLVKNCKEDSEELSPVTFDECVETPVSDRHHLQPLLGYDWIAGVLDAEDTFVERSDEFFNDLRNFRSLHKDECVHSPQAELSVENHSGLTLLTDKDDTEANTDNHQCTFSYRINSRLFPVPLHHQECCPVCKKPKSSHPHTTAEPALIRVSIPRSTLLPPYKYKAHRRCSFDSSDSLGLPSHCLSGWSHTGQSTLPPPSSLDLRSSLNTKNNELENLSVPVNQISDQISNVSKLARHNFQHFSPRNKMGSTSYPGC
ncbi:migration and invasion-inhibitory protein isoform X2 [Hippoglossus stenolepis]|uniref:migration and invasion-inhibitory protein isoform X2 n=1 Tax=Hippoglossus stenolepis TaxID=195615 RepID=UPI00159C2423|nr:migration and invasion-inhibitory protein isoform X2 [Hippoglossus stenolepis]